MKRYRVTALVTISVSTVVEAKNAKEAIEEAKDRPIMGLCQQCARGETDAEEWVTSGELDGQPKALRATAEAT